MSSLFSAHRGLAAISEARKIISNLSFQDLSKELKLFDHMSMLYTSCISTPPHPGGGDSNFDSGARIARIAWSATDMTEAFTTTHGLDDSSKRRLKNLSLETENTQLYLKPCRGIIANASLTNLWNLSFNKKWTSKSFIFQQYCITRLNCFSSLFGQIWVKVQCCSVTQTKSCQFCFNYPLLYFCQNVFWALGSIRINWFLTQSTKC